MNLTVEHLCVDLGGKRVLHEVSCAFPPGWTAVVGPNGAGKSTLLRAMAGVIRPDGGTVRVGTHDNGVAVSGRTRAAGPPGVAWLDQSGRISGELTVRETVALGRVAHLGLFREATASDVAAIDAAMQATACLAQADMPIASLSGGERQRALLARVLATEAPVLLLDEPTTHLDPPLQVAVARLLKHLGATRTVISVMHDLTLAFRAERVLLLEGGVVTAHGPRDDPGLHAQVCAAFAQSVRIERLGGEWVVIPAI